MINDGKGTATASPYANAYTSGRVVTLTAVPEAGQGFLGWSGDASGTVNPLAVTMNASRTITANFTKRPTPAVPTDLAGRTLGGFRVMVQGEFGASYTVLGSTHLPVWFPLGLVAGPLRPYAVY